MKHSRLVFAAVAVLALGTWAPFALACEGKAKATTAAASSKSSACTAEMAAKCTPEMAAACKAKGATAASMAGCPAHATSARTAAHSGTTVSTGSCGSKASKTKESGYDATTITVQGGASTVDAVLIGAGGSCSHGASKSTSATAAGAGGSCSGHGAKSAKAHTAHADCDACADMAFCDGEVSSLGATVQIVPLKNGVMYVYTADDANKIHAVQASMARRNDHMSGVLAAGDKAKLCPSCKTVRGAIASGKLSREFVNIEGGCLTLMTSNDPATVARIYSLAGLKGPVSIKS